MEYEHTINIDRNWSILFDQIEKERVVPIVGREFYYVIDNETKQETPIEKYLCKELAKKYNIPPDTANVTSISDAIEDANYMNRRVLSSQTDIYYEIDQILKNTKVKCRENIVDFLAIGKFPLILTTSYVSRLESELIANYGNVKVVVYDKSSRADIDFTLSTTTPSLYYLFGKCSRIKQSFLVTEDDLLDYLHLWHNLDTRPQHLSSYLKDKFLLVLGCNYPNWLFRFFWHSIRNFTLASSSTDMQAVVAAEQATRDKELSFFLSRIQTLIYEDCHKFVDVFMKRWIEYKKTKNTTEQNNNLTSNKTDLFISYAREDASVVLNLAEKLRLLGAEVWLDENKLEWSDMYETIIDEKIREAKRFIPIISKTTIAPGRRYFKKEWAMALREMDYRLGSPYFAPIVIDSTDINNNQIPEPFRKVHIININSENLEEEMKKLIRSFR